MSIGLPSTRPRPKRIGAVTTGHAAAWDADGNLVDGGTPGGSGITQLTGDVTAGPGSGSQAATFRAGTATSVLGRAAGSSGVLADIAAGADDVVLARSGGSLAFQKVAAATMLSGIVPATHAGNPEVRAALTPPVNADFTWLNQGSSTIQDDTDSVVLTGAATGSGANWVGRYKAAPATPYVITVYLLPLIFSKNFLSAGLFFRESGTGRLAVFDLIFGSVIRSAKFTGPTAFSADYQTVSLYTTPRWFRIADNGTNRICSLSLDGQVWTAVHTVGRTDFLTGGADGVGFGVSTENSATPNLPVVVRVQSWAQS